MLPKGRERAAAKRRSPSHPSKLTKQARRKARLAKLTRKQQITKIMENRVVLVKGMENFTALIKRQYKDQYAAEEAEFAEINKALDEKYGVVPIDKENDETVTA